MLETDPVAAGVQFVGDRLIVELTDGRTISAPLDWFPRLLHASGAERSNWRLLGGGYAIEWTDLDEHIGVEGLLAGRRSGESKGSFTRWLAEREARASSS
ncbi:MAG TPA: DUF2442 domain-containing protein [Longimicrobiaceae bacterium]|nr:DUF2442 domain-containing protein [Longimicrobiaceae bacterium]